MKKTLIFCLFLMGFASAFNGFAQENYLGDIKLTAINFDQRDWLPCDGRLLPIASNTALFSLIGTTYGGNGQTTFALPDLRGRVPVGIGSGPGLSPITQGQKSGSETTVLTVNNIPAHSHQAFGVVDNGNSSTPTNSFPAETRLLDKEYATSGTITTMNAGVIGNTGNGQAVNNMQPYIGMRYVICVQGIYPSRN